MGVMLVYVTAADAEAALRIGRAVVEDRLAACANVLPGMRSLYWWAGAVQEAEEAVLILKTAEERLDDLVAAVKARHSYELPCIVALPVAAGLPAYLGWIAAEARGGAATDPPLPATG
jgi:periplasmic divalent cation tolerance protein